MPQARAWQRMLSGRRLDLLDPSPLDVEIEDIAHGLAFVARWNGQTIGEHAYSVAEHSLLVEELFALLRELRKSGITLLLIEQNAKRALENSDHGVVLELGRMRMQDSARAILGDSRIGQLFLGGGLT